jgi:hypothetical protein
MRPPREPQVIDHLATAAAAWATAAGAVAAGCEGRVGDVQNRAARATSHDQARSVTRVHDAHTAEWLVEEDWRAP